MKSKTEVDSFKEAIRGKHVVENPEFSASDAELWERVLANIEKQHKPVVRKISFSPLYAKAAAVLLVISSILGVYYWNKDFSANSLAKNNKADKEKTIIRVKPNESISSIDEPEVQKMPLKTAQDKPEVQKTSLKGTKIVSDKSIRNYNLSDGSVVTLNTGSFIQIENDFNVENRVLTLEGEAYFEIHYDKSKPFKVYFDGGELEVRGTKFNVRSVKREAYKEISVTEGIVAVKGQGDTKWTLVKAGEQVKIDENKISKISKVIAANYISWKTGDLNFKNVRLEEVAIIMTRIYKKEIIADEKIKNCKYTGDLSGLTLEESLEIIKITNSFKIEESENKVLIKGEICD